MKIQKYNDAESKRRLTGWQTLSPQVLPPKGEYHVPESTVNTPFNPV